MVPKVKSSLMSSVFGIVVWVMGYPLGCWVLELPSYRLKNWYLSRMSSSFSWAMGSRK